MDVQNHVRLILETELSRSKIQSLVSDAGGKVSGMEAVDEFCKWWADQPQREIVPVPRKGGRVMSKTLRKRNFKYQSSARGVISSFEKWLEKSFQAQESTISTGKGDYIKKTRSFVTWLLNSSSSEDEYGRNCKVLAYTCHGLVTMELHIVSFFMKHKYLNEEILKDICRAHSVPGRHGFSLFISEWDSNLSSYLSEVYYTLRKDPPSIIKDVFIPNLVFYKENE